MPNMQERLIEELDKLGDCNRAIAKKLGCPIHTVRFWRDCLCMPSIQSFALFPKAGMDIYYILTGKHIGDIVTKACHNCQHFNECDIFDCDQDCDSCPDNSCRNCANSSEWVWEGFPTIK